MKVKVVFKIISVLFLLGFQNSNAQPEWEPGRVLNDSVHSMKVKTCMLTPVGSLIDFPAIALNSNEQLLLQFDDFDFDSSILILTNPILIPGWSDFDSGHCYFDSGMESFLF